MTNTPLTYKLSELDVLVLHATPPNGRGASLIADRAETLPDVTLSTLRQLRNRGLVEHDDDRPPRKWLRTLIGDLALEFLP
jgi:hypothetical protein